MKIIDPEFLAQFRGPGICEYCRRTVRNREPHHLFCRGMGGACQLDVMINLMALCATFSGGQHCHHRYHFGIIPKRELIAIVAHREGMTPEELEAEIRRLQRETR